MAAAVEGYLFHGVKRRKMLGLAYETGLDALYAGIVPEDLAAIAEEHRRNAE